MVRRAKPPAKPNAEQTAKEQARKADLNRRIDEYIAWTTEHPSIHDHKPASAAAVTETSTTQT